MLGGVAVVVLAAFLAVGAAGAVGYVRGFWLYRGFPPPREASFVTEKGRAVRIEVASPALGGRRQPVYVYLPPGYDLHPHRRYPALYLLHGFPGRAPAFLMTVRAGVVEDALVALGRMRPLLLVMPFGSTGTFTDKEWANGVRPNEGWETFVASDVVRAVDRRFRTIPQGSARALGGLSEGGYAALNIGLHHPGEFRVLESWSGYERAFDLRSIFGGDQALLRWNSPLHTLALAAPSLRRAGTFVWFYSASGDPLHGQNEAFARALAVEHVPYRFLLRRGGHDWGLWRGNAADALLAVDHHLRG